MLLLMAVNVKSQQVPGACFCVTQGQCNNNNGNNNGGNNNGGNNGNQDGSGEDWKWCKLSWFCVTNMKLLMIEVWIKNLR